LSITNLAADNYFGIQGTVDNYTVPDSLGRITELPPEGWVVEFVPQTVNTTDLNISNTKLFPNPTSDKLHLTFPEPISGIVSLQSIDGKVLHTEKINQALGYDADISKYDSGVYLVQIITDYHIRYLERFLVID